MDSFRFDHLVRRFAGVSVPLATSASAVSRRVVLRGAAASAIGAAAVVHAPRQAEAALCPERVPRKNYEPEVNGCGPMGYGLVVPDSYGVADFTDACNRHDRCYGTCNRQRHGCDINMLTSMRKACRAAYGGVNNARLGKCLERSNTYYAAVAAGGQGAYEDAQRDACRCCRAPSTKCGDTCCNTQHCMVCRGGRCQSKCGKNQYCHNNVCKKFDCGPYGCGG